MEMLNNKLKFMLFITICALMNLFDKSHGFHLQKSVDLTNSVEDDLIQITNNDAQLNADILDGTTSTRSKQLDDDNLITTLSSEITTTDNPVLVNKIIENVQNLTMREGKSLTTNNSTLELTANNDEIIKTELKNLNPEQVTEVSVTDLPISIQEISSTSSTTNDEKFENIVSRNSEENSISLNESPIKKSENLSDSAPTQLIEIQKITTGEDLEESIKKAVRDEILSESHNTLDVLEDIPDSTLRESVAREILGDDYVRRSETNLGQLESNMKYEAIWQDNTHSTETAIPLKDVEQHNINKIEENLENSNVSLIANEHEEKAILNSSHSELETEPPTINLTEAPESKVIVTTFEHETTTILPEDSVLEQENSKIIKDEVGREGRSMDSSNLIMKDTPTENETILDLTTTTPYVDILNKVTNHETTTEVLNLKLNITETTEVIGEDKIPNEDYSLNKTLENEKMAEEKNNVNLLQSELETNTDNVLIDETEHTTTTPITTPVNLENSHEKEENKDNISNNAQESFVTDPTIVTTELNLLNDTLPVEKLETNENVTLEADENNAKEKVDNLNDEFFIRTCNCSGEEDKKEKIHKKTKQKIKNKKDSSESSESSDESSDESQELIKAINFKTRAKAKVRSFSVISIPKSNNSIQDIENTASDNFDDTEHMIMKKPSAESEYENSLTPKLPIKKLKENVPKLNPLHKVLLPSDETEKIPKLVFETTTLLPLKIFKSNPSEPVVTDDIPNEANFAPRTFNDIIQEDQEKQPQYEKDINQIIRKESTTRLITETITEAVELSKELNRNMNLFLDSTETNRSFNTFNNKNNSITSDEIMAASSIAEALPNQHIKLVENSLNATLVILICVSIIIMIIAVIVVTFFRFRTPQGVLDIEMQEQRLGKDSNNIDNNHDNDDDDDHHNSYHCCSKTRSSSSTSRSLSSAVDDSLSHSASCSLLTASTASKLSSSSLVKKSLIESKSNSSVNIKLSAEINNHNNDNDDDDDDDDDDIDDNEKQELNKKQKQQNKKDESISSELCKLIPSSEDNKLKKNTNVNQDDHINNDDKD